MVPLPSGGRPSRAWDLRSRREKPITNVFLPGNVMAMDAKPPYLYVACGETTVNVYDLRMITPGTPYQVEPHRHFESPLTHQIKSISGFPNNTGFAIGTMGGRVAMMHLDKADMNLNFAFSCHTDDEYVYPINDISFHPLYDSFATCGADGRFCIWDRNRRQMMKSFAKNPYPISFGSFNSEGDLFAYSTNFEWGAVGGKQSPDAKPEPGSNKVFVHYVEEAEVKPKEDLLAASTTGLLGR